MDVAVRLLAPEAQYVKAFSRHRLADRLTDSIDGSLEIEILAKREVARHLLAMFLWRDEDIAVERRVPIQERDDRLVLIYDRVLELGIAREHLANEAASPQLFSDLSEVDVVRRPHWNDLSSGRAPGDSAAPVMRNGT
jgi:hypothetical protein